MSCAYDLYSSNSHKIIKQLRHDKRDIESNKYDQLCNRIEDCNRLMCLLKHRQPVVCNPKAGEAGMSKEAWESDEDSDGAILPDQDYRSSILASGSLVSESRWTQMFQRSWKKEWIYSFCALLCYLIPQEMGSCLLILSRACCFTEFIGTHVDMFQKNSSTTQINNV